MKANIKILPALRDILSDRIPDFIFFHNSKVPHSIYGRFYSKAFSSSDISFKIDATIKDKARILSMGLYEEV